MEELLKKYGELTKKINGQESVESETALEFLRTAKALDETLAEEIGETVLYDRAVQMLQRVSSFIWNAKTLKSVPLELLALPRVERDLELFNAISQTPFAFLIEGQSRITSSMLESFASFMGSSHLKEEIKREIREELIRELRREEIDVEGLKARIKGEIERELDGLLSRVEKVEEEIREIRIRIGGGEDLRSEIERLRSEIRDLEFRIREEVSQAPSGLPLPEIEEIRMRLMELEEKLQDQKPVESFSPPPAEEERAFFVEEEEEGAGREQKEEKKPVERKKKGLVEVLMNNWQIVVGAIGVLLALLLWLKK